MKVVAKKVCVGGLGGPVAVSRAKRNLDSPGLEMAGNCSWEAHPTNRNKASVTRQLLSEGAPLRGCKTGAVEGGRPSPASLAHTLCQPGPVL
ncbi:hypothetical protein Cadr_000030421 [Camelus dromedarius]|uniref:Uncharacterized protein n=1 Tax=Camelus dromedarius TaxID=9838 RepID=A0A5N4BYK7_CAMDR|nr:hypothetical protein Cadr_000030421 [Camelus dromedarius]